MLEQQDRAQPLMVSKAKVAELLTISERTIEHLMADGRQWLPTTTTTHPRGSQVAIRGATARYARGEDQEAA